ncbi:MAG: hypothetical protein KJO06_10065 [Gemmatimonadetes bacterium]|nr:hypothetical protein [Gemmatimonadota bacterium]
MTQLRTYHSLLAFGLRCSRLILAGLVLLPVAVAPGLAQELRGRVLLGDTVSVSGATVELHRVSQTSGVLLDSAVTDRSGSFAFALGESEGPEALFLVGARFGGILYWGPPIHAMSPLDLTEYSVTVFDTAMVAAAVADLRTTIRHVVLTPGVAGMQVEEIIDIEGKPDRTLVADGDSVFVWKTGLAEEAHGVVPWQGGVPADDLAVAGGTIGFLGALPPTGIRVVVQYVVASSEYSLSLDHDTDRLELLVMPRPGVEVKAVGVTEESVGDDMRIPVRRFTASDLAAGAEISVVTRFEEPMRGRAWVWLLAALSLGVAAVLSVRISSRSS